MMTTLFSFFPLRHRYGAVIRLFLATSLSLGVSIAFATDDVAISASGVQSSKHLSDAELLKAAQNPVADLVSVPIEFVHDTRIGPYNRSSQSMSLQPVIPMSLTRDWMLISRTILPLNWQAKSDQPAGAYFGIGDIGQSLFLVPKNTGDLIWGVGTAMLLPTASKSELGTGKFSIGPSMVVLAQPGDWTLGSVIGHIWSVAGASDRASVSRTSIELFVVRTLPNNWYVSTAPRIVADWNAPMGDRWLIPLGVGIGRLVNIGDRPVDLSAGFYRNVRRPEGSPDWRFSFQMTLMFPK